MAFMVLTCARCAMENHAAERFCASCNLPLGTLQADAGAGFDALGPYEPPEPTEVRGGAALRDFLSQTGYPAAPFGSGWRIVVPLPLDRRQAVYLGNASLGPESVPVIRLVSVCCPANERDARALLRLNAHLIEAHFAVKQLRGEEYFIVNANIPVAALGARSPRRLVERVAQEADGLEDRITRGRDLF